MHKKIVIALALGMSLLLFGLAPSWAKEKAVGAVYTMTNDPGGNAILVFNRDDDGGLTAGGTFPTGGTGTGGREPDFGLGNADALALSDDEQLLFVVNPGSDDVSLF